MHRCTVPYERQEPYAHCSSLVDVPCLQYAVRGNVMSRSMELQRRMAAGEKMPFDKVRAHASLPDACLAHSTTEISTLERCIVA